MLNNWKFFSILLLVVFFLKTTPLAQTNKNRHASKYYNAAMVFEADGKFQLAEIYYRKAIKAMGIYADAEYKLCYLLAEQLRFAEAEVAMSRYLKQSNADKKEYGKLDEIKRAARLQAAISSNERPRLEDMLEYIQLVSIYSKNLAYDALPFAQKATALYPEVPESLISYAAILNKVYPRQKEKELELINKALRLDPDNPNGHYQLGKFWEVDDRKIAILEFQKALELSSGKLIRVWYDLGMTYMFSGNNMKAVEAFRTYLKLAVVPAPIREEIQRNIKLLS